jgi:hypothetical protein
MNDRAAEAALRFSSDVITAAEKGDIELVKELVSADRSCVHNKKEYACFFRARAAAAHDVSNRARAAAPFNFSNF